jgi:hypothetical protein
MVLLFLLCSPCVVTPVSAQSTDGAMSEAEIDQLRDVAYVPADRIAVFIKLLDTRAASLQSLVAKPRRPGREEDLHELLQQFVAIIDELNDNLDDYGPRHRDIRKQLPKLLEATDRWSTALRSPADSDVYKVSRSLALEGVQDARDETKKLTEEQKAWFAAHPPAKETTPPTLDDRR